MAHAKDISTYILKVNYKNPNYLETWEPEKICAFPITIWDCIIE